MIQKDNFFIISGGPGSGKTSVIEELVNHGYATSPEVGREIIQEQHSIESNNHHTGNKEIFAELMLSRSIHNFNALKNETKTVFFDRAITELVGYFQLINKKMPAHFQKAAEFFRYNTTVFLTPPWQEIYGHDEERKQDFAEAIATYEHVRNTYQQHDYSTIDLPKDSISARVDFIKNTIPQTPTPIP